jgi:hypothetical protein
LADFRSIALKAVVPSGLVRPIPNNVNVIAIRKQLKTLVENSAISMHTGLPQNTLHDKIEEVA